MVLHHVTREMSPLGVVVGVLGVVAVVGYDGLKRILKVGDNLQEDDNVVTSDQSSIVIGLADGSGVTLGQDSEMTMDVANLGESAFRPDAAALLQAIKDGLGSGLPASASEALVSAAHAAPGQSPHFVDFNNAAVITGHGMNDPSGSDPVIPDSDDTTPVDDDVNPPPVEALLPELSIGDVSISEPAADSTVPQGAATGTHVTAVFTLTLSEASNEDVTIHYRTVDGTATSGSQGNAQTGDADYQHVAGVITIPAGETSATISITVNGDNLVEGDESFSILLHHVDGAILADNLGSGIIVDNETDPQGDGQGSGGNEFGGSDSTPGNNEATDGDDIIHGNGSNETISALAGDDVVFGAGGDDNIKGGHGDDSLIGGAGDDNLIGNLGDDVLLGQIGDDILSGNAGDDLLLGGRGEDLLSGGGGSDVFAFTSLSDAGDVITDFKVNQNDAIDISELLDGYNEGDDISEYVNLIQDGGDLQLHVDPSGGGDFTLLVTLQDAATQLSTDPVDLLTEGSLIINSNTIV